MTQLLIDGAMPDAASLAGILANLQAQVANITNVTGTISAGQVAFGTGTNTIAGDANLTWDGTALLSPLDLGSSGAPWANGFFSTSIVLNGSSSPVISITNSDTTTGDTAASSWTVSNSAGHATTFSLTSTSHSGIANRSASIKGTLGVTDIFTLDNPGGVSTTAFNGAFSVTSVAGQLLSFDSSNWLCVGSAVPATDFPSGVTMLNVLTKPSQSSAAFFKNNDTSGNHDFVQLLFTSKESPSVSASGVLEFQNSGDGSGSAWFGLNFDPGFGNTDLFRFHSNKAFYQTSTTTPTGSDVPSGGYALYPKLVGGKVALMVLFPTGSEQQIKIEA